MSGMPAVRRAPGGVLAGVLQTIRPRQWTKNVLVVAAPLAAGRLGETGVLASTLLAFVVFVLGSSAVYLLNDVLDAGADRAHPVKRNRPVAAGVVPVPLALGVSSVLALLAVGLPLAFDRVGLFVTVGSYLVVQILYVGWLKHEPVLDMACVASGFLLRAIAGGAAANLTISRPFLVVAGFAALFVVAGKRYSELTTVGTAAATRRALLKYTPGYLRFVWSVSAAVTLVAYTQWAFELSGATTSGTPWAEISVVPFTLALLRYARDIDGGVAEAPEDVILRDLVLLAIGLVWLVLFSAQVVL